MSRYLILVLLNLPLIIAGMVSAVVAYKMKRTSHRRFVLRMTLWTLILLGLMFAEPIYKFLFSKNLTATEPLSLFDVMQITGIIFTFFFASQAYGRVDSLERKVQDLHQELSIRLAEDKKKAS